MVPASPGTQGARPKTQVDAFCIGAPRSATTWFLQCLGEHPQVTVSTPKEPNFFVQRPGTFADRPNPRYLADPGRYDSCFSAASPGDVLVDGSVTLMANTSTAPELLKEHNPEAALLVVLRDPVARAYSNYWHDTTGRDAGVVPPTFREALGCEQLVYRSLYHEQLNAWEKLFRRDQLFVLLDLDIKEDPARSINGAYEFLGVDRPFTPPSLARRLNPAQARRPVYAKARSLAGLARDLGLGRIVDSVNRPGLIRLLRQPNKNLAVPQIDPDDALFLLGHLESDIHALESWLDRDLTPWIDRWRRS